MAARCTVVRSPNSKRLHVRSKKMCSNDEEGGQREDSRPVQLPVQLSMVPEGDRACRALLSISLSPEIEKIRDNLAKVAVLWLVEGHVNQVF